MSDLHLTAGVARIDITPPVGFRMEGAMRRVDPSVGVESPLLATALVLADEQTKVVVIDCDLIGFDMPLAAEIRKAIAAAWGYLPVAWRWAAPTPTTAPAPHGASWEACITSPETRQRFGPSTLMSRTW